MLRKTMTKLPKITITTSTLNPLANKEKKPKPQTPKLYFRDQNQNKKFVYLTYKVQCA